MQTYYVTVCREHGTVQEEAVLKSAHLADQVAVAKAWGEKLAELEADHLAVLAVKEEELFAARRAILAGGIREGDLEEQIEEQNNILNPGEYISEQERNGVTILVLRKDLWDIFSKRESAEKEEDWQLKYDLLIADYEQKWGLSMRQDEQIAALTEKLEFYRKNRTVRRLDALTAENKWLREMERIGKLMGFLIELNLGACGFIYSYILDETGKARDAAIEFMKEAKCSDQ